MAIKKEISTFNDIERIISGEGSFAKSRIRIKYKPGKNISLKDFGLKNNYSFAPENYFKANDQIKKVLDLTSISEHEIKSRIYGKEIEYDLFGRSYHRIKFNQELETPGIGEKNKLKVLEVKVSFWRN